MCINGQNCFRKEEIPSKLNNFKFNSYRKHNIIKIDCPCHANHTYHCGKSYCAVNKRTCDLFNNISIEETFSKSKLIKDCNIDFIIIEKDLSWFEM